VSTKEIDHDSSDKKASTVASTIQRKSLKERLGDKLECDDSSINKGTAQTSFKSTEDSRGKSQKSHQQHHKSRTRSRSPRRHREKTPPSRHREKTPPSRHREKTPSSRHQAIRSRSRSRSRNYPIRPASDTNNGRRVYHTRRSRSPGRRNYPSSFRNRSRSVDRGRGRGESRPTPTHHSSDRGGSYNRSRHDERNDQAERNVSNENSGPRDDMKRAFPKLEPDDKEPTPPGESGKPYVPAAVKEPWNLSDKFVPIGDTEESKVDSGKSKVGPRENILDSRQDLKKVFSPNLSGRKPQKGRINIKLSSSLKAEMHSSSSEDEVHKSDEEVHKKDDDENEKSSKEDKKKKKKKEKKKRRRSNSSESSSSSSSGGKKKKKKKKKSKKKKKKSK